MDILVLLHLFLPKLHALVVETIKENYKMVFISVNIIMMTTQTANTLGPTI